MFVVGRSYFVDVVVSRLPQTSFLVTSSVKFDAASILLIHIYMSLVFILIAFNVLYLSCLIVCRCLIYIVSVYSFNNYDIFSYCYRCHQCDGFI